MELRYCEKCGDILQVEGQGEKIDPSERFVCRKCQGRQDAPREAEKTLFDGILDKTALNLFSASTIALKRKELTEKDAAGSQVGIADTPSEDPSSSGGSSAPAPSAKKLQFRCLHCRASLLVRPVERTSRMVCPRCKENLYIDPSGIVTKTPPAPSERPRGRRREAGIRRRPSGWRSIRPGGRPGARGAGTGDRPKPFRPGGAALHRHRSPERWPAPAASDPVQALPLAGGDGPAPPAGSSRVVRGSSGLRSSATPPRKEPSSRSLPVLPLEGRGPAGAGTPGTEAPPAAGTSGGEPCLAGAPPPGSPAASRGRRRAGTSPPPSSRSSGLDEFEDLGGALPEGPLPEGPSPGPSPAPAAPARPSGKTATAARPRPAMVAGSFLLAMAIAAPLLIPDPRCIHWADGPKAAPGGPTLRYHLERLGATIERGRDAVLRLPARLLYGDDPPPAPLPPGNRTPAAR